MTHKDSKPQELKAFDEKFNKNTKLSGMGLETTMHLPCAFCAEPDYMIYRIIDTDTVMKEGAICKACKRGMKAIFHVNTPTEKRFEFVQFCGPDAPRFLPPIRRIYCRYCDDTHKVKVEMPGGGAMEAICTKCPKPCTKCQRNDGSSFCKLTPCACTCHVEKNSGTS